MTARKSIYTIIAAISVALVATVALVSIGNIGAQSGPSGLTDIPSSNCGGTGESDCATGRIYAVNKWSQRVNTSAANGNDLEYTGPDGAVDLELEYVGDGNSLYASFLDEDEGVTGVARWQNTIIEDSDVLIVVVEDQDAVRNREVKFTPSTAIAAGANSILVQASTTAGALNNNDLPILGDVTVYYDINNNGEFDGGAERFLQSSGTPAFRADVADRGQPLVESGFITVQHSKFLIPKCMLRELDASGYDWPMGARAFEPVLADRLGRRLCRGPGRRLISRHLLRQVV